MQRHHQHVRRVIEDRLRAVAVVHVDIEDRRRPARGDDPLRGDRGVVEVAEAAGMSAGRMVARRPRQRVGSVAIKCRISRIDRRIRRAGDRVPCPRAQRR